MKRLGIFCFYDKEGKVDTYVDCLLDELRTVLDKLIIVVNGQINEMDRSILLKYADDIIIRLNRGFDIGAYVDVLKQMNCVDWKEWDELVLCNDTFYGPFVPMKDIFIKMANKDVDFWGLNILERGLLSHIQSYFLVFRKNILCNEDIWRYLYENVNVDEEDITNIYGIFEPSLFRYLDKKGYKYGAYANTQLCDIYRGAQACIEKYGLPILKKKFFSREGVSTESHMSIIKYLHNNTNYDVRHILRNLRRTRAIEWKLEEILSCEFQNRDEEVKVGRTKYTEEQLFALIRDREFYIYGEGILARELFQLYFCKEGFFKGFVISDTCIKKVQTLYGFPVMLYSEIPKGSLVVLGVNVELSKVISKQIEKEQRVLCLWR